MDEESIRLAKILRRLSPSERLMVRAMLLAGLHLVRSFEIVDRHGRPAVSLGKIKLDETWFDLFDDE